jgi:hypothetical protein
MLRLSAFFVLAAAISYATSPALAQTNASLADTYIASPLLWKTISLGTYTSSTAMFDALDGASVHIGDIADEVLHRPAFTLSKMKTHVQLVVLSASDLGLGSRDSLASLYARARRFGYELCPPEVAVQLRLQYRDQPVGEFLDIAMEPIATYEGELAGLSLANGGAGLMIVGQLVSLETSPASGTRFVFVRPTQIARPDILSR